MIGSNMRKLTVPSLAVLLLLSAAPARGVSYRYDGLNRLASVTYDNGMSIGYSYDANGNIVRIARAVAGADLALPSVTAFSLPATSGTLRVGISALTGSDNVGVTGYCVAANDSSQGCTWSASAPSGYTFPQGTANGSHTLFAFAKDAAGNVSLSRSAAVTLDLPLLTVTIATPNSGRGSVNSTPSGIACVSGEATGCSVTFDTGANVTLIPLAADSTFGGWSGACTNSSGNCLVTMDASKGATATFTGNPAKAVIEGSPTPYFTLGSALDAVTASGQTVRARDITFVENVVATKTFPSRILGGYTGTALDTRSSTSFTTIDGTLKIRRGALRVDHLKIR